MEIFYEVKKLKKLFSGLSYENCNYSNLFSWIVLANGHVLKTFVSMLGSWKKIKLAQRYHSYYKCSPSGTCIRKSLQLLVFLTLCNLATCYNNFLIAVFTVACHY